MIDARNVKSLEWHGSTAKSAIGEYSTERDEDDSMNGYPWVCWSPADEGTNLGHFPSLDEARAAAKSDYETRILSAIDHTSTEPVTATGAENAQVAPDKKRPHSMTLNLSDVEIAALEALAKKQELSREGVLRQGLRHYQLLVHGEPDLGPMLDPALAASPSIEQKAETDEPHTNEISDFETVLARLAGGEHISYSRDGETAWLSGAGREWIPEATVFYLRNHGYLLRLSEPDEPYSDRDVISETGKVVAKLLPSNTGSTTI